MITSESPYLIGETAFHHQGETEYLKKLILAAADLELDAIKFHLLFDVGDYFVQEHPAFETLKAWTFISKSIGCSLNTAITSERFGIVFCGNCL